MTRCAPARKVVADAANRARCFSREDELAVAAAVRVLELNRILGRTPQFVRAVLVCICTAVRPADLNHLCMVAA